MYSPLLKQDSAAKTDTGGMSPSTARQAKPFVGYGYPALFGVVEHVAGLRCLWIE
jgi:hypothetical protein